MQEAFKSDSVDLKGVVGDAAGAGRDGVPGWEMTLGGGTGLAII